MDRDAIMEMLREYGVNSEADLDKAIQHLSPVNIGIFVTPLRKPANHHASTRKDKENVYGEDLERACV